MAQDLIQYVRDNFEDDYVHNYVNSFDGGSDMYYLDMNPFTESKTLDHSSNSETFLPTLFGSRSPTEQEAAMDIQHLPCYSPDTVLVHAHASSLPSSLQLYSSFDSSLGPQEEVALDVQPQEQILVEGQTLSSITGTGSSAEGERSSCSFWRGKSPAVLMQQLKGPSLSASSSSSEAQSTTPLGLTSLWNHFQGVGGSEISAGGGAEGSPGSSAMEAFSSLSKCALGFGDCRALQPQNEYSIGTETMLCGSHLGHKLKVLSGLEITEEMQLKAAATAGLQSGNNSWSCSTSPMVPSSKKDGEVAPTGRRGMWKKVKGEASVEASEDALMTQAAIFANAIVEQKEQKELQEKFLALLQLDSSTPEDHKAQILDDTIRYLKVLRRRQNFTSDGVSSTDHPLHLEDLKLDTAGVEISPLLTVEHGPHIEVRMMENQHVAVKLTAIDRPGLFHDIMQVLRGFRLDIQHANIRTDNKGQRNDIFSAKMQLPLCFSHSTSSLAVALNQAISARPATPSASPQPHI